jgi:hypothetical protein
MKRIIMSILMFTMLILTVLSASATDISDAQSSFTDSVSIQQIAFTGAGLDITRNYGAAQTDDALAIFENKNAGDNQNLVELIQPGSGLALLAEGDVDIEGELLVTGNTVSVFIEDAEARGAKWELRSSHGSPANTGSLSFRNETDYFLLIGENNGDPYTVFNQRIEVTASATDPGLQIVQKGSGKSISLSNATDEVFYVLANGSVFSKEGYYDFTAWKDRSDEELKSSILNIKGVNGEIDHDSLPVGIKGTTIIEKIVDEQITEIEVPTRDLGASITYLMQVAKLQEQRINELESELCNVKGDYKFC